MTIGHWIAFSVSWVFAVIFFALWTFTARKLDKGKEIVFQMFIILKSVYDEHPEVLVDKIPNGMEELFSFSIKDLIIK